MKKRNIIYQIFILFGICSITLLTGCGITDGQVTIGESFPLEEAVFDGDAYFVTSNTRNMTNQEIFDFMVETPSTIFSLLNLIDEVLLRGNVEIDDANTIGLIEELKSEITDFEEWLLHIGFQSEAELLRVLELEEMRIAAVSHLVNVTDEAVQAMFDDWAGDDDTVDFEEYREAIYGFLYSEAVEEVLFIELARLRYEAGLEIFNDQLKDAYESYLAMIATEESEINLLSANEPSDSEVIAHINGVDITRGQLFNALVFDLGMDIALTRLEADIVEDTDIESLLEPTEERLKEIYENFVDSEKAVFEQLRDDIDAFGRGSHILVSDFDFALELIEQLEDADEFAALFAELAYTYSNCPSGERSGGDLGAWNRGQMVEPFDEAFFELELGDFTSEPVETDHGYHIIYRPVPVQEDVPEFEELRDELNASEISHQMQNQVLMTEILMGLIEDANITFTNPYLQARFRTFMDI